MKGFFQFIIIVSLALAFGGCKNSPHFTVSGAVAGATDKILYLEQLELNQTVVLDSIRLSEQGKFNFKQPVPEYPDYYRLRLGSQVIPFSISEPVNLVVTADVESFQISYAIEGSSDAKMIREVWLAQMDTDKELRQLMSKQEGGDLSMYDFGIVRDSILGQYKQLATKYIYNDPGSPVAYFALFQQVDGNLIYNVYDRTDSKAFAAVANLHLHLYPDAPRTKHLESLALNSIAVLRTLELRKKQVKEQREMLGGRDIREITYIDFTLPDINDNQITFSEIVSSSPTLLCFSTMDANWSALANQQLLELHQTYGKKGLKIVQVSLDRDPHIWKATLSNYPWINLRDHNGGYSQLVGYYNLTSLPTLFYLEEGGEKIYRIGTSKELIDLLDRL